MVHTDQFLGCQYKTQFFYRLENSNISPDDQISTTNLILVLDVTKFTKATNTFVFSYLVNSYKESLEIATPIS